MRWPFHLCEGNNCGTDAFNTVVKAISAHFTGAQNPMESLHKFKYTYFPLTLTNKPLLGLFTKAFNVMKLQIST
jgi:hypothetical protein